jgi:stage II sporulation protein D
MRTALPAAAVAGLALGALVACEMSRRSTAPPRTAPSGRTRLPPVSPPAPPPATAPVAPPGATAPAVLVGLTGPTRAGRARVRIRGGWVLRRPDGTLAASGRGIDASLVLDATGGSLGAIRLPPEGAELDPDTEGDLRVGEYPSPRTYEGALRVERSPDGRHRLCVAIDMEKYVASVVNSEIPASFPREAQRVQAIIARTYALASAPQRSAGEPIRLADVGAIDQEFAGLAPVAQHRVVADDAARSTAGMVLFEHGSPLAAYYCSSCGGATCPAAPVFGVPATPALAGVTCPWCREGNKYHDWRATIPGAKVAEAAGLAGPLAGFTVAETTLAGRALSFDVRAGGRVRRIPAAEFRLKVGPSLLRSALVEFAAVEGADLVVRGHGWGHGVGLCQMGARTLAERGVDAEGIVRTYYPGAEVRRLW